MSKKKELFEELSIGEAFSHNNFKYVKVSGDYARTVTTSHVFNEVNRYFDGTTRIKVSD